MAELSVEHKVAILKQRVLELEAGLYGLEADAYVAKRTQDEELLKQVQSQMKKLVLRLEGYKELIGKLGEGEPRRHEGHEGLGGNPPQYPLGRGGKKE